MQLWVQILLSVLQELLQKAYYTREKLELEVYTELVHQQQDQWFLETLLLQKYFVRIDTPNQDDFIDPYIPDDGVLFDSGAYLNRRGWSNKRYGIF